ncbi:cytochrome c oxidase assembly protein [Bradymonas sediminis]|uniref:Cytochrome c oxidase assembly protein CtaG n=1 Tax=Bradymonas sediminis TaxID=1548548 RepID=A0A2Z4FN85_9DELT|nr:cytochrome c oxidase assembly protein [Bradymonas sediminis]AWV90148.1 cytochrome c oxidase assembly protein [Bradymonas sediminis]TDP75885.1 cytochrome c oxidase assembly protein subunit 11 [Bradymonas sediminis]
MTDDQKDQQAAEKLDLTGKTTNGVLPYADGTHVATDHTKLLKFVGITLAASFALAWGSIPLYRIICAKIDPGGSSSQNGTVSEYTNVTVDESRELKIRFSATVNSELPWEFVPTEYTATVHPGEKRLTKFYSKNLSYADTIVGKGVYDIVPPEAAQYFKKIECFCFTEQTLAPSESMDMPLYFWFDPDIPKHITNITLSYTFFKVKTVDTPVEKAGDNAPAVETASAAQISP